MQSQRSVQPSNYMAVSRGMPPPTQGKGQPPPRPPPPNIPPLNQHEPYGPGPGALNAYGGSMSPMAVAPGQETHAIRPSFARNNTQVLVIDDKAAESYPDQMSHGSPSALRSAQSPQGPEIESPVDEPGFPEDEGLTLADIPQLLESEQAREQHRSLPRQTGKPLLAELTPLELVIIKNFAVLALQRSALKDDFDLEEIVELIEVKKSTFWNRLFKGNDKKNVKKKGEHQSFL